jgi:hypothetical protein
MQPFSSNAAQFLVDGFLGTYVCGKAKFFRIVIKILLCQIRIQFGRRTPETQNEHFLSHKKFFHQFYIIPDRDPNNTTQFNVFKVEGSLDFIKI